MTTQALFSQLLIGLINGSFYALLSLGLAVIFGLLNVVNFCHGALYMLGALVAWYLLEHLGLGYWYALFISPLVVGLFGVLIERTMLRRLYGLDPLYGLLLTFGLALIIQGVARNYFGVSGEPYDIPSQLTGGQNLGFMFLPNYRAWVVAVSVVICFLTWFVVERTRVGAYLRAAHRESGLGAGLRDQRAPAAHRHLRSGRRTGGAGRSDGRADHPGQPADGGRPDHRGLRGGGHRRDGIDLRVHPHRIRPGGDRGADQGLLSRGLEHGDLRDHGHRPPGEARRALRENA